MNQSCVYSKRDGRRVNSDCHAVIFSTDIGVKGSATYRDGQLSHEMSLGMLRQNAGRKTSAAPRGTTFLFPEYVWKQHKV